MKVKKNSSALSLPKLLEKINAIQKKNDLLESSKISGNCTLLLDTSSVTTTQQSFQLNDSWKNYKMLYFTVEMNYTSTTDIYYESNTFFTGIIMTDYSYMIYREVASGSTDSSGALEVLFNADDTSSVSLNKSHNTYNGARRVYIHGIN